MSQTVPKSDVPQSTVVKKSFLRQHGGQVSLLHAQRLIGAELHRCALALPQAAQLTWQDCQLLECTAEGGNLGSMERCMLRGARLTNLRVHSLRGCDLSHARLTGVDLQGADLQGACFYGATFQDCKLDNAQTKGMDLRGVLGLTSQEHQDLLQRGARALPHWQAGLGLVSPAWTVLLPALAIALSLSVGVALSLPQAPGRPEAALVTGWVPSPDAVAQTQIQIQDFRAGIVAAHLSLKGRGGRSYPTLEEVQGNHYDRDGDGPGQALEVLFPKGLPRNLLSPGEGSVLPYCNTNPDQLTLSEEDADWHYCPDTGRVLASAGQ
ncbi:MAG: hypothetical protein ACI9VR_003868, partial [Cognaticolwellia sp.]